MTKRFISIAALLLLLMASAFVPAALADDDDDGGGGADVTVVEPVAQFVCMPDLTPQRCDPRHQVAFSGEADRATFDVSPTHCSSISVELFVNGVGLGPSPFLNYIDPFTGLPAGLPTSFTWVFDFDVGDDIEIQATGRPGGCNAGALTSWGGTLIFVDEAGGGDDDDDDDDDDDEDDD